MKTRTTITIDEKLFTECKLQAVYEKTNFSDIVSKALKMYLEKIKKK